MDSDGDLLHFGILSTDPLELKIALNEWIIQCQKDQGLGFNAFTWRDGVNFCAGWRAKNLNGAS